MIGKRARGDDDNADDLEVNRWALIKAASEEGRVKDAIDMCTEEMRVEGLSKSTRMRLLLSRSSLYLKLDGAAIQAVQDSKQAVHLAPSHAPAYMIAAKALHAAGRISNANKALGKAVFLTADEISTLHVQVRALQAKWSTTPIQALPDELLVEIFSYLKSPTLYACLSSCQRWKRILILNPRVWGQLVVLRGTMGRVAAQWKSLSKLTAHGKVCSLELDVHFKGQRQPYSSAIAHRRRIVNDWNKAQMDKTFPFETLQSLQYTCTSALVDYYFWTCVMLCKNLQFFHWKSHTDRLTTGGVGTEMKLPSMPYLTDISISSGTYCKLTAASVDLFAGVRRIRLAENVTLGNPKIGEILEAAKDTLEEAQILVSAWHDERNARTTAPPALKMMKLHTYATQVDMSLQRFGLEAPNITKLSFLSSFSFDASLMRSCRRNLTHFVSVGVGDSDAYKELSQNLQEMPECESLSLFFYNVEAIPSFWTTIRNADLPTVSAILPKLKRLIISGDLGLTGGEVVKLVQSRSIGLVGIEALHLYQCPHLSSEAISQLKRLVPTFTYRSNPLDPFTTQIEDVKD